ncbi:MAG: signal peptidase I [Oscillospiraceae bacterium]|jgi:signal peptidase|nr:signal peptidase I [Oscillospiraceae bacterium]
MAYRQQAPVAVDPLVGDDDPFAGYLDLSHFPPLAQTPPPAPPTPRAAASVEEYLFLLGNLEDEGMDGLPPLFGLPPVQTAQPAQAMPQVPPGGATAAVFAQEQQRQAVAKRQRKARQPLTAARVFACALNVFVILFCTALIGGTVLFTFSSKPDKSFFGLRFYNVTSGSMTPVVQQDGLIPKDGFREGDAIVVQKIPPEDVVVGDIITFEMQEGTKTKRNSHRVIKVMDQWNGEAGLFFVTKGDANDATDDMPVPGKAVIGKKIVTLPWLGKLMQASQGYPKTFAACSAVLILCLLLLFFRLSRPQKKKIPPVSQTPPLTFPAPEGIMTALNQTPKWGNFDAVGTTFAGHPAWAGEGNR